MTTESRMQSTVLKASKELAESIAATLLSKKGSAGKSLFAHTTTDTGFEVWGKIKGNKVVVLRYHNTPAPRIDYDGRLITIE